MNNKILIFLLLFIIIPFKVNAECSEEEKIRISKLANNITSSIEYNEETNSFTVTFLNLTGGFLIEDDNTKLNYQSDFELNINDLKSGNHKFNIYDISGCYQNEVLTKNIKIPFYNQYYNSKECNDFQEYTYCSKWLQDNITYNTWKKKVDSYKKNVVEEESEIIEENKKSILDNISDFLLSTYVDYYYVFLPLIIIAFTAIIYLKDKSDSIIYRKNKGEDITL